MTGPASREELDTLLHSSGPGAYDNVQSVRSRKIRLTNNYTARQTQRRSLNHGVVWNVPTYAVYASPSHAQACIEPPRNQAVLCTLPV